MKISNSDFAWLCGTEGKITDSVRSQTFLDPETFSNPLTINPKAVNAYWFDRYGDLILARHFLEEKGCIAQVGVHEGNDEPFVIFTNYGEI